MRYFITQQAIGARLDSPSSRPYTPPLFFPCPRDDVKYTITIGDENKEYPDRQAAIDAAKEESKTARGEIAVTAASGQEILTYRGGELASYLWDDRR